MIENDYIDPYTGMSLVRLRGEELRREAEHQRMVEECRLAHPELRARNRMAAMLRRAADRLAPEPATPAVAWRPVNVSRPSPS
ncbi:hypothetical protein FOE78_00155 [Microlunatus elymi]|uniref:Uncharacterized protein n=1 Tax=Microlunatus elymi TaxID=2596828 RepID=A0A516PTP1_9ACTN|nr:hypothetical protein [Microlunatus elymi]QDP94537.1 hypothetical protein FOE78_00155 [Microlunatus elymi]